MKNQKLVFFVTGMSFSFVLMLLYSFTSSRSASTLNVPGNLDPATAAQYRQNYNQIRGDRVAAINLSVQQLNTVNQFVQTRSTGLAGISGFRLYFGAETPRADANIVSIVYPLDEQLEEVPQPQGMPSGGGFSDQFTQQCPPFCD